MVADELRARYRTHDEIRARGALGNLSDGVEITTHGVSTRLIAWPGTGYQTEAVHVLTLQPGERGQFFVDNQWVDAQANDCVLAPCGVAHGHRSSDGPAFFGGFASPPQLDLLIPTDYYEQGRFTSPKATRLRIAG